MKKKLKLTTKYFGPTDTRGSRIVATATIDGKRRTLSRPYDHVLTAHENHMTVADLLLAKWGLDSPSIEKELFFT